MHVKVSTTFFGIRSRMEFRCNESTAACVWPSGVLSHQISCRIFSRTTCKHFNSFFSPIVERPQLGFSKIALAHSLIAHVLVRVWFRSSYVWSDQALLRKKQQVARDKVRPSYVVLLCADCCKTFIGSTNNPSSLATTLSAASSFATNYAP